MINGVPLITLNIYYWLPLIFPKTAHPDNRAQYLISDDGDSLFKRRWRYQSVYYRTRRVQICDLIHSYAYVKDYCMKVTWVSLLEINLLLLLLLLLIATFRE